MSVKVTDRIVYPSRATAADALDGLETTLGYVPEGAEVFLPALDYYATRKGIDNAVITSHSGNECNLFRDPRFKNRKDAFGIGVTEAGVPGASFKTYDDAAFYAVTEYCQKLGIPLTDEEIARAKAINPAKFARVEKLIQLDDFPKVTRISEMNSTFNGDDCWWMCDDNGPEAIVQKAASLFPNLPDQGSTPSTTTTPAPTQPDEGGPPVADLNMTKGLIPLPNEERNIIDVSKRCQGDGRGFDWLGDREIDALYVHRSQGTYTSNKYHFESYCPAALTDIQIDHVTGRVMRFVDLARPGLKKNAPSGWANGVVSNPVGDAAKLIAKYGGRASAVNQYAESCEVTGFFGPNGDDPLSPEAKRSIAQWMASRAHDKGITYLTFPMIPAEDRSFIIGHRESRGGKPDDCPGDYIWSLIATDDAELIVMARAIMKAAQTKGQPTPSTTTTAPPTPPAVDYPKKRVAGPDTVSHLGYPLKVNKKNRFLCTQGGKFKTAPSLDAPDGTPTPYKAGRKYTFDFQTPDDEWLFAKSGSWAPAKNFEQLA